MKFSKFAAASSVALMVTAVPALALTVTFDSFDTNQVVTDVPLAGSVNTSTVVSAGGDIFGGSRTLTAGNTLAGGASGNSTTLEVFDGALSFSNKDAATGSGTLFYDGDGAGLGNLVIGKNPFFFFDVLRFDNDANVLFTATGFDGVNTITYSENLSAGFSPKLSFVDFADGDPFDFTNVEYISFVVDTSGLTASIDGAIAGITLNAIPLPASALLLLGGLGGLAGLRRRRKS